MPETIKLPVENTEENLHNLGYGNVFLGTKLKAQETKAKQTNGNTSNLKSSTQ